MSTEATEAKLNELKQLLGFHPLSFLDDVINATHQYIGDGVDVLEKNVRNIVKVKKTERSVKEDIKQAVDYLEQKVASSFDKELDTFELYTLNEIFGLHDGLLVGMQGASEVSSVIGSPSAGAGAGGRGGKRRRSSIAPSSAPHDEGTPSKRLKFEPWQLSRHAVAGSVEDAVRQATTGGGSNSHSSSNSSSGSISATVAEEKALDLALDVEYARLQDEAAALQQYAKLKADIEQEVAQLRVVRDALAVPVQLEEECSRVSQLTAILDEVCRSMRVDPSQVAAKEVVASKSAGEDEDAANMQPDDVPFAEDEAEQQQHEGVK